MSGRKYFEYTVDGIQLHIGRVPQDKVTYNRNIEACLQRDKFTCQICRATANLNVHHKDTKGHHLSKYESNDNLANLQTLCVKCHMLVHYNTLNRNKEIVKRHDSGETFQGIANDLAISRQRVQQIYTNNK